MRGKGISIGLSQSKTCSGRKTLKRCKNNGEANNVVLIDVDSDNFNNVPESLPQKLQGSSVVRIAKKCPLRTVIYIDDDENTDSNHPGRGVKGNSNFYNDASSSMRSCPTSNDSQNSVDTVGDECQFSHENISPLKISKCKRTYSGRASSRNRYGLSTESENGSSDNDIPDCEFMEDSFGKLQEQWEKASLKRKYDVHNGQSCVRDQVSASKFCTDTHQNVGVETNTEKNTEVPLCSTSSKANCEKKDRYPSNATVDVDMGNGSRNPEKAHFADTDLDSTQKKKFHSYKVDDQDRIESFTEDPSCSHAEWQTHKHFEPCGSNFHNKGEQSPQGPLLCPIHEQGNKEVNYVKSTFKEKKEPPLAEPCSKNSRPRSDTNFCHRKANLPDEEASLCMGQDSVKTKVDHARFGFRHKGEKFQQTPSSCNSHFSNESGQRIYSREKEKSVFRDPSIRNGQSSDETLVNSAFGPSSSKVGAVPKENFFCKISSLGESGDNEMGCDQEKGEKFQHIPSSCNSHFSNESEHGISSREKENSVPREPSVQNGQPSVETLVNHAVGPSSDKVEVIPKENIFCKIPSLGKSGDIEKGFNQEKGDPVLKEPCFCNSHLNEAQLEKSCSVGVEEVCLESTSTSRQTDERDNPLHNQDGHVRLAVQTCIINEREKLKETDEYKIAIEEEWASRQRALEIQAEQAQQLRRILKRRKAENMRLLDMWRRQKQRVEEMRETQKKDEENMNLKELLRSEVRKELNQLEITCHDMASLLRGLGIQVSGGPPPLAHELRAAYKRALLSFHPDRASRYDIRQQVEAEEKFKLISRMKEKFLLTS